MYEGKDGTIEDIITGTALPGPRPPALALPATGADVSLSPPFPARTPAALKSVPFTARTAKRGSRFFCDPSHHDESSC